VALVLAKKLLNGKGAVRVHGGGFGGTILCFVPNAEVESFTAEMNRVFGEHACDILYIRPTGAGRVF
jgi:galactokinase